MSWVSGNLWWLWSLPMVFGLLWALFGGQPQPQGHLPAPPRPPDSDERNALIHLDMAQESIRAATVYLTGRTSIRGSHACSEIRNARHRLSSALLALNGDERDCEHSTRQSSDKI